MFWNREDKIHTLSFVIDKPELNDFSFDHRSIVLAPGCFDLLHYAHVDYLHRASLLGDRLIVGLNSDVSVRRSKPNRPIIPQLHRARQLAALECVDDVVIFYQDTPEELIEFLHPKVVVVGIEWGDQNILQVVTGINLGQVVYLPPALENITTTALIQRLKTVPEEK